MKILIAEDEGVSRRVLEAMLQEWGYEVIVAHDGNEAWRVLQQEDAPPVAILDWIMPGMDGIEVCRLVRKHHRLDPPHLILLTVRGNKDDIVEGLKAGANDYVTKPFHREELRARVDVGRRMVEMQSELAARVKELQDALSHIKTLQGILPICSYCKKIRNDENYWQQLESYLVAHSDVQFSHSACPECYEKYLQPQLDALSHFIKGGKKQESEGKSRKTE